ncbi:hypothetical protein ASJ79_29840, partial [Mycobacterium sp. NAZ190054]
MTASPPLSSQAGTILHGVPVVAGVQYAPVIRPGSLPDVSDVTDGAAELLCFKPATNSSNTESCTMTR